MVTLISVLSSVFVLQLTCSALQAMLWQRWLRSARWWWIVVCQVGVLVAAVLTTGWFFIMTDIFNLDILQNQLHSVGVMLSSIAIFLVVMVVAQWLFLRRSLPLAPLWAILNPIAIALLWFAMVSFLPIGGGAHSLSLVSVGIEMMSGVIAGLITGYGIKVVCDRYDARAVAHR